MVEAVDNSNVSTIDDELKSDAPIRTSITKPLRHNNTTDQLLSQFQSLDVNPSEEGNDSTYNTTQSQYSQAHQYSSVPVQPRQYPQSFDMQSIPSQRQQQQFVPPNIPVQTSDQQHQHSQSDYRQLSNMNQSAQQPRAMPPRFNMPIINRQPINTPSTQQNAAVPAHFNNANTIPQTVSSNNNNSNYSSHLSASAVPFESYGNTSQPIDRIGFQHLFQSDTKQSHEIEKQLFSAGNHAGIDFDKYDNIPVEVTGNDIIPPVDTFIQLNFPDILQHNIELCEYHKPTPIQKHALPAAWYGRDLMCCSQTGSGKTAAFLFPLIAALVSRGRAAPTQSPYRCSYPVGLILVPTRELATQIYDEACKFTYRTGYAPVVVYGGADPKFQSHELSYGCDILIATPGRLVDFIQRGRISMSQVGYLVFDEADRMLDMGFEPQIHSILHESDMNHMTRQTLMFSATFPKSIQKLAAEYLNNYIFIAVGRVGSAAELVTQYVDYIEDIDKANRLLELLRDCTGLTLVFVERKKQATELERWLRRHQISAVSIHGDKSQYEREYALDMFKSGQCTVLVATDVAARGLDINHVTDVVNFDLPTNIDDYVHRIGRTGRAGNTGKAHAFFNQKNMVIAKELVELLHENKQVIPPFLQHIQQSNNNKYGSNTGMNRGGRGGRGGARGRFGGTDYRQLNQYGNGITQQPSNNVRGGIHSSIRGDNTLMQHARQTIHQYQQQQQQAPSTQPPQQYMPMQSMLPTQMPSQS